MGTITVSGLGKAYKKYPSRWHRLREWLSFGFRSEHSLHWVIRDVSFTVNPGDAVGIIGLNGAGKSTLLKMIAGTTVPTAGTVSIDGRIAAMLELGMGFHPDFTGRENAVMAGRLLGMRGEDVERLMPEIEAFAEIGEYIDAPVRVYSSGMQVRLAFSVATVVRPDVLIIDEALSVGDSYFQHKSFERIRRFREAGTTLLIVSHDRQAIMSLCDRAILLNDGGLAMEGAPDAVMDYYNALLADHQDQHVEQHVQADGKVQTVSGTHEVRIGSVSLVDEAGTPVEMVRIGQPLRLVVEAVCEQSVLDLAAGFMIRDRLGQSVFGTNSHHAGLQVESLSVGERVCFEFDWCANLGEGTYSITVALHSGGSHLDQSYEWRDRAVMFGVANTDKPPFVGMTWLQTAARFRR